MSRFIPSAQMTNLVDPVVGTDLHPGTTASLADFIPTASQGSSVPVPFGMNLSEAIPGIPGIPGLGGVGGVGGDLGSGPFTGGDVKGESAFDFGTKVEKKYNIKGTEGIDTKTLAIIGGGVALVIVAMLFLRRR